MLGDANINLFDQTKSQDYVGFMTSMGLISCIDKITRPKSKTCLDHIWIGNYCHGSVLRSGIIETYAIADHFPIFLSIMHGCRRDVEHTVPNRTARRVFSTENFEKFSDSLLEVNWDAVTSLTHTDTALSTFQKKLFEVYDKCFPVLLLRPVSSRGKGPWYTSQLRIERKSLNRVGRKLADSNDTNAKRAFNRSRRIFRLKVKLAYKKYHGTLLGKVRGNPRKLWGHLNTCLGRKAQRNCFPSAIKYNGVHLEGPNKVAEGLCDYFSKIRTLTTANMLSGLDMEAFLCPVTSWVDGDSGASFGLNYIDSQVVSSLARSMKVDLKDSLHNVPSKVIQQHIDLLLTPILHIFNMPIEQGYFPVTLKNTRCIPLYKGKGAPDCPTSYRPISITSFLAKLFERCVKVQLERFLENSSFFSKCQFGFRRSRCTGLALCDISDISLWLLTVPGEMRSLVFS